MPMDMQDLVSKPDTLTLLGLVHLAYRVFGQMKDVSALPPDAQAQLRLFYDLSNYHGIAPPDAPHIPDTGI